MIENSIDIESMEFKDVFSVSYSYDPIDDPKKEGLDSEPNFFNRDCSIEFNVERELVHNALQLRELEVNDFLDTNIKLKLCYERIELIKLKDLLDDIKEVVKREKLNQEIQKEIIPHITYSNELEPKPFLNEQQQSNAMLFSELRIKHYNCNNRYGKYRRR